MTKVWEKEDMSQEVEQKQLHVANMIGRVYEGGYAKEEREKLLLEQMKGMEKTLAEAKIRLAEQYETLQILTRKPIPFAYVVKVLPESVIALLNGSMMEVEKPDFRVRPGDTVRVSSETGQILDLLEDVSLPGEMGTIKSVISDSLCEAEIKGEIRVVTAIVKDKKLEPGSKVVLDQGGMVILHVIEKREVEQFSLRQELNVSWEMIGGLDEAKKEMIETIEWPSKYPKLFAHYNRHPIRGVLLFGSPGCGKSLLGKAAATAIAKSHGKTAIHSGFIYVKGPEILDRWVGSAEGTIRSLFTRARKHKTEFGYPALMFIDEADAILGKRGSGVSSDMERTIVPMFLAEMDGLDDSGTIVILATNRADVLDPAVYRDGRIDRKIRIGRPDQKASESIFKIHLKNVPFENGFKPQACSFGAKELFSPERVLYEIGVNGDKEPLHFTLGHVTSGAMIAGIVEKASSIAMARDMETDKMTGICKEDLKLAIDSVFNQNMGLGHQDDLSDFIHDFKNDVTGIHKVKASAV